MLRSGASRALFRSVASQPARTSFYASAIKSQWTSQLCTVSPIARRPQSLARPIASTFVRRVGAMDKIDKKHEESVASRKMEAHPEAVSTSSSTHQIMHEHQTPDPERDVDMMKGIRGDMATIADTFKLEDVPRPAMILGLAGVLPYAATSLGTVYCAYEISHAAGGYGYLMSAKSAELLLHILEPLEIGYGAVIISFLGAIHWGLEWAGYGGYHGYSRYSIGVIAPAIAWPTTLLPVEYALIAQFFAFNYLYYADARACARGWTPSWYGTYRFVLTFIVGAAIVVSLIGRGQISDMVGKLPGPADRVKEFRQNAEEEMEKEERAKRARIVKSEESE